MKRVLLIAGGGTLGTYTAEELLRLGHMVDVICLEDKISNHANLRYFKANATLEYLKALLNQTHYDGVVNFIHFAIIETTFLIMTAVAEHRSFDLSFLIPCLCG